MKRKDFLQTGLTTGALLGSPVYLPSLGGNEKKPQQGDSDLFEDELVVEKAREGQPHKGKVLAVIQPHSDDISLFAGGTVAKLIKEGYTGYLIRTSNDEKAGRGDSRGEVIVNNEKSNEAVAEVLGLEKTYDLYNRNHQMDEVNIQDLKGRLIFLFRMLKVDTAVCYDPWAHYEENPDHYITARAVEAARWMAGSSRNYPEHFDAGVEPNSVREMYYFARYQNKSRQHINRIVDISDVIDTKVRANMVNTTQGPGGNAGSRLRKRLAEEGKKLPILGDDDEMANFNYIKHIMLDKDSMRLRWGTPSDKKVGEKYGLDWAERIHYVGPSSQPTKLDQYIEDNAVST
ncbi:PIG-L deacetylase family protein [Fodinibius sediminis]|uniref:N-acetylglucosaminyl deacetylase, LmbE family n=1 Tax=Fodinibius sediminis TaxID=1214077 RepID=A0A521ECK6_9BACT|nr:PIG-L family deacetylase [Fodinibius sediminis]SMO81201.1 N-acetylglucosaminyl deacetylase, LmbE family [Fodinibius sediminis]